MSKAAEDDYHALELYLQQAEQEIVQVFSQTTTNEEGPTLTLPNNQRPLTTSTKDGLVPLELSLTLNVADPDLALTLTSREQYEEDEKEIEDILCLYDNVDFYNRSSPEVKVTTALEDQNKREGTGKVNGHEESACSRLSQEIDEIFKMEGYSLNDSLGSEDECHKITLETESDHKILPHTSRHDGCPYKPRCWEGKQGDGAVNDRSLQEGGYAPLEAEESFDARSSTSSSDESSCSDSSASTEINTAGGSGRYGSRDGSVEDLALGEPVCHYGRPDLSLQLSGSEQELEEEGSTGSGSSTVSEDLSDVLEPTSHMEDWDDTVVERSRNGVTSEEQFSSVLQEVENVLNEYESVKNEAATTPSSSFEYKKSDAGVVEDDSTDNETIVHFDLYSPSTTCSEGRNDSLSSIEEILVQFAAGLGKPVARGYKESAVNPRNSDVEKATSAVNTSTALDPAGDNGVVEYGTPPTPYSDSSRTLVGGTGDGEEIDVVTGPILEPPPGFTSDSDVMETSLEETRSHSPHWGPQQPRSLPPGAHQEKTTPALDGYQQQSQPTVDRKTKHAVTPPPPSVDRTEKLISSTLNQHKVRKQSVDMIYGVPLLKPPLEVFRRQSVDSGIRHRAQIQNNSEAIHIDPRLLGINVTDPATSGQGQTGKGHGHQVAREKVLIKNQPGHRSFQTGDKKENVHPNTSATERKESERSSMNNKSNQLLDLLNSYSKVDNSVRSKEGLSAPKVNGHAEHVNISTSKKDTEVHRVNKGQNKVKPSDSGKHIAMGLSSQSVRTSLPAKPNGFPEKLDKMSTSLKRLEYDQSPEMQVMINSLSPVLLRRRPSNKSARSKTDSNENSPRMNEQNGSISSGQTAETKAVEVDNADGSESLFMDPEMARTWHGVTSNNWSQLYGPHMRKMMAEFNQAQNHTADTGSIHTEDSFELRAKTLPSKTLLDEMHKRFCADQYVNNSDAEVAKALVLLRLKSHPPYQQAGEKKSSHPKRSASFNIRMGTGTSSSSASSESSPLLPRVTERLKIKTRPDVKYSPKPSRSRETTPEHITITIDSSQAQTTRKEDAEIEAVEACRWLKETGFPQYAQMYEDGQFPVDVDSVEKDHDFLDKEDIQSLFRRLNTLNKCAIMKISTPTKKEAEDSDEEDQCALSDKWKYQRSSRRWSKIGDENGRPFLKSASSHDSLLADQNSSSETGDSPVLNSKMYHLHPSDDMTIRKTLTPLDANANTTMGLSPKVIRRAASEKIKGAKSFLRRMESMKSKRSRKGHKTIAEISSPVVANDADMQAKIKHLNCKDLVVPASQSGDSFTSSTVTDESGLQSFSDTSANTTTTSRVTSPDSNSSRLLSPDTDTSRVSSLDMTGDSSGVCHTADSSLSENEISTQLTALNGALGFSDSQLSDSELEYSDTVFLPVEYRPGRFPKTLDESYLAGDSQTLRPRSFSAQGSESGSKTLRRVSHDPRHKAHRVSIYDNVPVEEDLTVAQQELDIILSELFQNINGLNKAINGEDAETLEPPAPLKFDDSSSRAETPTPEHKANGDISHNHDDTEGEIISGTLSSPDISDHELPTEDLSHDDSAEHIECRERRDSGVGSSLTRTNSDRRKYRIRWHSFQKSHRPNSESRTLQICNLSAGQILMLRKLSLLKLTALVEKYSPNRTGWSLTVPRFMKRHKSPDYSEKNVFGVPFTVILQRTGQALPQCMLYAMRFLRRTADDALGIFRKSGVRSRIQKLRNEIEAHPESVSFDDLQAYDVADLLKQYFRELPECLLSNKLSDIFISIFIYVPAELRVEAMQAAVVLMPDENRDVLQSLLLFLSDIAQSADEHQMTPSNLAVCFAPSLFNMGGGRNPSQTPSPRRNRKNPGIPDARELMEQKAAHECLTLMILECKKLFMIPAGTLSKCRCWHGDPVTLDQLNNGTSEEGQGYKAYIESCIQGLLKESRDKFRGWITVPLPGDVDLAYKKVGDGHPLRLWKTTVEIEAPPNEVLNRVLHERQCWDDDFLQWNSIEKLDTSSEVFQYVRNSMAPHPTRDYCVLRSWRTDLPKGACVLISTSIEHPRAELKGGIQGVELASRYLIEPCGAGKSRLTHISRVDMRGHSPEWYKKVYGHICVNFMQKIRSSLKQSASGPETKV